MDLVGGYYDAGDNVKFGLPMAFTTTMLSWSILEFGDLMQGQLENAMAAVRWSTDYLLKAATAAPDALFVQVMEETQIELNLILCEAGFSIIYHFWSRIILSLVFYLHLVQVADPNVDHRCWERPEDMDTPRNVYKVTSQNPGSDVAAETAAALAAASIVFRASDPAYSKKLLQTAMMVRIGHPPPPILSLF